MASTVSEGTPGFLDHIHCSVCHRNLIASSDDTATVRSGEGALEDPFWMGECYHILCHREINGGQARDHKPLPSEIQAYCPKCSNTVYMVQLQLDQFPGPAQRFLQPFETSLSEMVEAYRFQFKHMSDLISHLKGKVFEQKQLLARVKQDLQQAWQWEKDLEEARKENFALRQEIQTLRLQPIKMETGGASGSSAVHRAGDGRTTAERGYLQPPSRGATFQQPRPVSQRPPSQARPALASVQVQRHDCDPQSSRPLTRPSSCASDVFAFKPPPLSFRAIPPTTFATRSPDTEPLRIQPGALPSSRPLLREAHSPLKRLTKPLQNPLQRHSSHGKPPYQPTRPTSRAAAQTNPLQFRRPNLLARTEDQLPHRIPTYPVQSSSAPPSFGQGRAPASAHRRNDLVDDGQAAADDVAMMERGGTMLGD